MVIEKKVTQGMGQHKIELVDIEITNSQWLIDIMLKPSVRDPIKTKKRDVESL